MTIDELTPSNITKAPASYVAGEAELETIAKAIEHGEIVIDKLSLAVKRGFSEPALGAAVGWH